MLKERSGGQGLFLKMECLNRLNFMEHTKGRRQVSSTTVSGVATGSGFETGRREFAHSSGSDSFALNSDSRWPADGSVSLNRAEDCTFL